MSDLLLEWMSYRREGRADALPADLFNGSPYRAVGNLAVLGHIEMPTSKSWRIAPPVLACLPEKIDRQPTALLCGARTPGLLQAVQQACMEAGAFFDSAPLDKGPSRATVSASSNAVLAAVAAGARIHFQHDAAYTLLACVPAICEWRRQPCQMAGGKVGSVLRFSGSRARWLAVTLDEAVAASKGFFRVKRDYDSVSIFKSSQTDCAYMDDRAGRMLAATKRRHAIWDSQSRRLSLPIDLYPPLLIARALVLCTGQLPEFDRGSRRISFADVCPAMLRLTLAITGLRTA
jgi:hypothetical protein